MKSPVVLLEDNTQFSDAWLKFQQYRFRHFPIVDGDNNLVGIVSDRDMLARVNLMSKAVSSGETDELVSSVMKEAVITASEDTSIHEICQVMFSQHIGALPIIGANHTIKGIITRSDILRTIIKNEAMEFWV